MKNSKLPNSGTTIFTKMSALAREYNAINLGQGFPNFEGSPILLDLVNKYLRDGKNQYAPMPGVFELREAIAQKISASYHNQLDPNEEICITAGATQAIYTIITAFIHPGDEVILFEPAYDSYKPSIEINAGIPVPYEMKAPDYQIDWEEVEEMITARTKMIIVNTPHNPTGSILRKDDLTALENLLSRHNILVLSDEVYEHLIYDDARHESILAYPNIFNKAFAVFSFGKTFHNTGWKIGYCCGPQHLMHEFKKIHQWNVFSVNSFLQYALAEFLSDADNYQGLGAFFQQKRDHFLETMADSSLEPLPCHGTYFQLFNYSKISDLDDIAFTEMLVKDHGVASIPVSVFYSSNRQDKVFRLCFAKTDHLLERAAGVLSKL